jgi:hypothetical protein
MKLIGNELGRVIVLASVEEWRPARGIPIASAVTAIQNRYQFVDYPNLSELTVSQTESEGYKFVEGILHFDDQKAVIREFAIFRDGFSVTAHDTFYAEAFLDDFLDWGRQTLEMRPFALTPSRIFRSQLVVQFERPLSNAFRQLEEIAAVIQQAFRAHTSYGDPVNVTRLDFGMDHTQLAGVLKPTPLVLERRVNRPYIEEVYFSDAALPSRVHAQVLEEIEARFA